MDALSSLNIQKNPPIASTKGKTFSSSGSRLVNALILPEESATLTLPLHPNAVHTKSEPVPSCRYAMFKVPFADRPNDKVNGYYHRN